MNIKDFEKKLKEQDKQKKRLLPFKNFKFLDDSYQRLQQARLNKLLKRNYENQKEKELWEKYLKIVQDSFKNDNTHQKFSLSHVLELGVEWNILFLYSKKDVGKTWAIAKYVDKLLLDYPDAQVMFIRNSKEEAKGFIEMMNTSEVWPTWTNGELVFRKEDVKRKKGRIHGLKPCGFFAYASGAGFTRWQGGDWTNLRFWNWDECNSVQGGLTQSVFQALNVLLSSLVRDKLQVKGIMCGNLLEKSNIFLERLGVGSKTRLKIFDVHKNNNPKEELLSKLLYLNTGDLFKGIESQRGLATQFLNEEELEGLLSNRPGLYTGKATYEELDLKKFYPMRAFIFRQEEEDAVTQITSTTDYILYTYKIPNSRRVVVWIDQFKVLRIKPGFPRIYCQNSLIANKYPMVIPFADEDKEEFGEIFIEPIEQTLLIGEIWYGWNGTEEVFSNVWQGLKTRYIKEDPNSV